MSEDEGTDWRWHYAQELNRASKLEAENAALKADASRVIAENTNDYVAQIERLEAENAALREGLKVSDSLADEYRRRGDDYQHDAELLRAKHEDCRTALHDLVNEHEQLRADLARARAVLDSSIDNDLGSVGWRKLYVREQAWQAWREGER